MTRTRRPSLVAALFVLIASGTRSVHAQQPAPTSGGQAPSTQPAQPTQPAPAQPAPEGSAPLIPPSANGNQTEPPPRAAAPAATSTVPPKDPSKPGDPPPKGFDLTRVQFNGFFVPLVTVSHRDAAVPRDRLTAGMVSNRFGLRVKGNPYEMWSYFFEVGFDASVLLNNYGRAGAQQVVGSVDAGDPARPTDASAGLVVSKTFTTNVPVESAIVTFQPADWYGVSIGRMRAPFSVGHGATITAQMFPNRPGPASEFMTGADDGLLNTFKFLDERIQIKAGAFNGSSLGLQLINTTTIGPVYSGFVDVHPLGKMPGIESDSGRGPFRIAGGVGTLYRIGSLYDVSGYQSTRFRDFRLSAALRVAYRGLFLQGEYLRRLQTDDLSLRPATARGIYAQGAFYFPIAMPYAIAPIARWGLVDRDEEFSQQRIMSYEGGIIFYPRADLPEPDSIRITVQYLGEQRSPAEETANGGVMQLLFKW